MDVWAFIGIGLIFFLLLSGAPLAIAFALGSSIVVLMAMGTPLSTVASLMFNSVNSFPLLASPFFILAGSLIFRSGGMEYLRDFMQVVVGQVRGGLAVAAVIIGAFLGALSGSSAAGLAIMGTIVLPIMVESGYDRPFCAALALNGGELSWIIPPSLALIIFGSITRISIPDLFLAGIGTGILAAIFMVIIALVISKRRNYPVGPQASWRVKASLFVKASPYILMPVVVLGGIYSGIFSPTESGMVATFYVLLIGLLVYRKLTWAGIRDALWETASLACVIYALVASSVIFGNAVAYLHLPDMLVEAVLGLNLSPIRFLLMAEALLLAMGFLFSGIPMIIVVLPLFLPVVYRLGIDPVLYGILAIIATSIGEITPPVGPQLWLAAPICKVDMGKIIRESWPFLGAMALAMVVATFVPGIAMGLVNLWR